MIVMSCHKKVIKIEPKEKPFFTPLFVKTASNFALFLSLFSRKPRLPEIKIIKPNARAQRYFSYYSRQDNLSWSYKYSFHVRFSTPSARGTPALHLNELADGSCYGAGLCLVWHCYCYCIALLLYIAFVCLDFWWVKAHTCLAAD